MLRKRRNTIFYVIALCFASRLIFFLFVPKDIFIASAHVSDSGEYFVKPALFYLAHSCFPEKMVHPFLYPFLIAVSIKLHGSEALGLQGMVIFQIICSVVLCWAIYRFTKDILGEKAALISGLIFAIEPSFVIFTSTILADTLMNVSFFLGFYFLLKLMNADRLRVNYIWLAIVLFGCSIYLRPMAAYLPVLILIPFGLYFWLRREYSLAKRVLVVSVLLIIFVQPWFFRNYKLYGKYEIGAIQNIMLLNYSKKIENQASCRDEDHFHGGIYEDINGSRMFMKTVFRHPVTFAKNVVIQTVYKLFEPGSSAFAARLGLESNQFAAQFRNKKGREPVEFIDILNQYGILEIAKTYLRIKSSVEIGFSIYDVLFVFLIYWGAFWGVLMLLKDHTSPFSRSTLVMWLLIAFYVLVLVAPLAGGMRYRMTFVLMMIPLASFYWVSKIHWLRKSFFRGNAV